MTDEMRRKEVNEAIRAGEQALGSLRTAEENLASARKWGIADMLGGGLIVNVMKHSRLDDASYYLETAKKDLERFQRELGDVPDYEGLRIDIGNFLSFADFFFDGLIVDYMVQSRISEARDKIQEAIRKVEHLLTELRRCNR